MRYILPDSAASAEHIFPAAPATGRLKQARRSDGHDHRFDSRGRAAPGDTVGAALAGRHAADHARAIGDSLLGVEGALRALRALPYVNGKVGVFGTCSGGRHAYLAACRVKGFDVVVDCWGGRVVMAQSELTPRQPVAPIDYTQDLSCPLLGLFGEEDHSPTPEQVAQHERELQKHGKTYEFHMYPKAGHGFFYYDRPNYRQEQAVDGWQKLFAFLEKYLRAPGGSVA